MDQFLISTYNPQALWAFWSLVFMSFAGWIVLERFIPARRQKHRGKLLNLWAALVVFVLCPTLVFLLTKLTVKIPQHPAQFAPPAPLAPIIGLIAFDFFYYWFHRLQHTWRPLWAFHSLHHSDENLDVTTTLRHHWTEEPLRALLLILPMSMVISISPGEAAFLAAILGQWPYFIHANVRINLGPITPFIAGPQLHRIHHSIEPEHRNKNFAAYFPIWDVFFGTYWKPTGFPSTGITEPRPPASLKDIVTWPLTS